MSFQAMAWAVQQDLPMREKMVLLMLANYASNERGDCHPSVGLLSKDCGASKDSVMRAVKALEDAGLLSVNRRTKDGVNLPNTYTLNMQGVVAHSDHRGSRTQQGGVVAESDTNLSPEPITSSLRSEDKRTPRSELASVLDSDRAAAVIEHRQRIRKPLTAHAAKLLAGKFAKCPDPNAAADAMIANGWQGFEPEWMQRQQSRGSPPTQSRPQTAAEILRNRRIQGIQTDDDRTAGTPRLVALGHVS